MRKIFIVLLLVVIVIALVWFLIPKSSQISNPVVDNQNPFPIGETKDIPEPAEIKSQFEDFISAVDTIDTSTNFLKGNQIVPLPDFLSALDSSINPRVSVLLDPYVWQIYRCADISTSKTYPSIVLSLQYMLQLNYSGNFYQEQISGLREWEKTLFEDIAPIIFPANLVVTTQQSDFSTNKKYPYIDLREAKVTLSNGQTDLIRYIWVGDELLISNDLDCILRIQEKLFDTGA